MEFENRRWLVIPTDKIDDINFDQVLEPNKESLRKSLDNSLTFIKYDVNIIEKDIVETYTDLETLEEVTTTTKAGVYGRPDLYSEEYTEYNHEDILALLSTEAWTKNEMQ
mgnify:CR=1 FL=1|tara:strand:- start:743 stop:1072 length:330 start_codon:yes stop_codon:yes gene_type:complete